MSPRKLSSSEEDCHATEGIWVREISEGNSVVESFERLNGRYHARMMSMILPLASCSSARDKMMDMFDAEKIVNTPASPSWRFRSRHDLPRTSASAPAATAQYVQRPVRQVGDPSVSSLLSPSAGGYPADHAYLPYRRYRICRRYHPGSSRALENCSRAAVKAMAIMTEIGGTVLDDTKDPPCRDYRWTRTVPLSLQELPDSLRPAPEGHGGRRGRQRVLC